MLTIYQSLSHIWRVDGLEKYMKFSSTESIINYKNTKQLTNKCFPLICIFCPRFFFFSKYHSFIFFLLACVEKSREKKNQSKKGKHFHWIYLQLFLWNCELQMKICNAVTMMSLGWLHLCVLVCVLYHFGATDAHVYAYVGLKFARNRISTPGAMQNVNKCESTQPKRQTSCKQFTLSPYKPFVYIHIACEQINIYGQRETSDSCSTTNRLDLKQACVCGWEIMVSRKCL